MTYYDDNQMNTRNGRIPQGAGWDSGSSYRIPHEDLFESLRSSWQYDELAAEVGQESQARVALIGLRGAGKRTLFNRFRGGGVAWQFGRDLPEEEPAIEAFGSFLLVDLPGLAVDTAALDACQIDEVALYVYVLDATRGVTQADMRWIAALRARGTPLVVALNKIDAIDTAQVDVTAATLRLGLPVVPLSALLGTHLEDKLLPAMLNAVPRLAVPLGREIMGLRRHAARRVIRQAALMAGLLGIQPVPGLDLPFQTLVHVGVVMRVGAVYGHAPSGGLSREVIATVGAVVLLQYVAQTILKFVPYLGSLVGGALATLTTFIIGEVAVKYYEAGARLPVASVRGRLTEWQTTLAEARSAAKGKHRTGRWRRRGESAGEADAAVAEEPRCDPATDEG